MARQQQKKQHLSFVGGLNTESSPLTFPEGTAKDLDNVDLQRDGSIKRRRGINFESPGALSATTFTAGDVSANAVSTHVWQSVAGNDGLNFLVIQIGGMLYFHELGRDDLSIAIVGSFDLAKLRINNDYKKTVIDAASGEGKFFIVSPNISPSYLTYNDSTDSFTGTKIVVKIRDLEGLSEQDDTSAVLTGANRTPSGAIPPEEDINDGTIEILNSILLQEFTGFGEPSAGF